jgi:hypothetical protein
MVIVEGSSLAVPASWCEIPELTHSTPTVATTMINPIDEARTVMRNKRKRNKISILIVKLPLRRP